LAAAGVFCQHVFDDLYGFGRRAGARTLIGWHGSVTLWNLFQAFQLAAVPGSGFISRNPEPERVLPVD
jgi:hypothetical protein